MTGRRQKPPLGTGARFRQLEEKLRGKVDDPAAVAAAIGRKKYGARRMAEMAAHGRKKAIVEHLKRGGTHR